MTAMYDEDDIKEAMEIGMSGGQVSIAEYVLKVYSGEMSERLKLFLQKVVNQEYAKLGKGFGKPSEDIALEVTEILEKSLKK